VNLRKRDSIGNKLSVALLTYSKALYVFVHTVKLSESFHPGNCHEEL